MRITTFDIDERRPCGIEESLRRLAASPEQLKAACWQGILELVERLQSRSIEEELWAHVLSDRITLWKTEPLDPVREWQMKRFMAEWRSKNPDPSTWGTRLREEMQKRYPPKPKARVSVWLDWRDYGPLRDGLPEMYYRIQIENPGKTRTEDARAKDVAEAEHVICEAFGL